MKAADIHQHFVEIGPWVDWSNTTDGFHFGDPKKEVETIVVAWNPYWQSLKQAHELGCDFFLTHESIFREGRNGDETEAASKLEQEKLAWPQQSGMAVYSAWPSSATQMLMLISSQYTTSKSAMQAPCPNRTVNQNL